MKALLTSLSCFVLIAACGSSSEPSPGQNPSGGNPDGSQQDPSGTTPGDGNCSCTVTVNGEKKILSCGSQACVAGSSFTCGEHAELAQGGDACTSPPSPVDGGTSKDSGSSAPSKPTDAQCAEKDTVNCHFCCTDNHVSGWQTWQAVLHECMCAPDACASECATSLCKGPNELAGVGKTCNDCIDLHRAACLTKADTSSSCKASTDCKALVACDAPCRN